ncbi:MAG: hypothetical protein K5906_04735 [Bacilli bacterium]|nr:hypothetical protein [Bacilli bacterium]
MKYLEFEAFKEVKDEENPFSNRYYLPSGEVFYIEPVFYTQLRGFKELREKEFPRIIERMIEVVKKNKKVIFTGNFECPQTLVDDDEFIILEINDITDPLEIYVEDKSRGSDYGD